MTAGLIIVSNVGGAWLCLTLGILPPSLIGFIKLSKLCRPTCTLYCKMPILQQQSTEELSVLGRCITAFLALSD